MSLENRLLEIVVAQLEEHRPRSRDAWDVLGACSPRWRNGIYGDSKQPPEIWEPFLRRISARAVLDKRDQIESAARRCESPIEELFFLALLAKAESDHCEHDVIINGREPEMFDGWTQVLVFPQYTVGKYRADFLVAIYDTHPIYDRAPGPDVVSNVLEYEWKKGVVLVELDGHDFHEKTKEQASRDKKKDRDLQAAGFTIYRFTGSDIWNRPMACAKEVLDAAERNAKVSPPIARREGTEK
jgi:hypothetical protein